jgi:antitoxin protein of toxin-antitoxin system
MSIMDKMKAFLGQHGDKVDKAVDKAGDMIDQRTGGKYADKVDKAQEQAKRTASGWGEEGRRQQRP